MNRRIWNGVGILSLACLFFGMPVNTLANPLPQETAYHAAASSDRVIVKGIRHWTGNRYTRVVLDLAADPSYDERLQQDPLRLSIDLHHALLPAELTPLPIEDGTVNAVQIGQFDVETVRVVLNVEAMESYKVFKLSHPSRLVIDVFEKNLKENPGTSSQVETALPSDPPPVLPGQPELYVQTIVVDPGHGGEDPGAIGKSGLQEKNIVLDVGLRLKELLEKRLGKKVIMTRDQDVFIPLQERTEIANRQGADLFLSIHANASPRKEAKGIETYLLGRSSTRDAMIVAARENSATEQSTGDLEMILADLLTTVKKEESLKFAHYIQGSMVNTLQTRYPVVDLGVKQAPFYVLVNAQMPSILAEISFVSNPDEEKRLASPAYRQQIAEALLAGVEKYITTVKFAYQNEP
jgi:N-acetylmuramoyl-L-alanine amidase